MGQRPQNTTSNEVTESYGHQQDMSPGSLVQASAMVAPLNRHQHYYHKKLVPWGTDGRLPLSDLDLDLGSGHTAYRRASLVDLYLRSKFH